MTDLDKILNHKEKALVEAENTPAKLLRGLMYDMNIGPLEMSQFLTRWLDNPLNGVPRNGNDRSNKRGNLIKEISRPSITWSVFEKAITLFNPVKFKISVELDMGFGKIFKRDYVMDLKDPEQYKQLAKSANSESFTPTPFSFDSVKVDAPKE